MATHTPERERIPEMPRTYYSVAKATGEEPTSMYEQRVEPDNRSKVLPVIPPYVTPAQMVRFARGILQEYCELSNGVWSKGGSRHKTFSQPDYLQLQHYMRGYGLIEVERGSKANGYQLTSAGRRWLEEILAAYLPH
jgi:hypothetical protein